MGSLQADGNRTAYRSRSAYGDHGFNVCHRRDQSHGRTQSYGDECCQRAGSHDDAGIMHLHDNARLANARLAQGIAINGTAMYNKTDLKVF